MNETIRTVMRSLFFSALVLVVGLNPALADQHLQAQSLQEQLKSVSSNSQRIDLINNYVDANYIQQKAITASQANEYLLQAEKYLDKTSTPMQQYRVYTHLYIVQTDLKNPGRANGYKKKAALLNIEMGDIHKKEIDEMKKTVQEQEGTLHKLNQENKAQDRINAEQGRINAEQEKIIEETSSQLSVEIMQREQKEAELKAVQQEKAIQELQLQRRKTMTTVYAMIIGFLVVVFLGIVYLLHLKQKQSRVLAEQNKLLAIEKQRSDDLLLNILPLELADELKASGHSEARSHESVTVMFTDFVEFSRLSELMSAKELVHEIDYCFKTFDQIIAKYNIEKIKTVGDCYLCASGIPSAETNHAENIINAAMEIRDFVSGLHQDRTSRGLLAFTVRIGIHSGPLVAGIVGIKKFAYDIWGDTVNIASRMETSCLPGKINVSETTYQMVKDKFSFTYRGKVEAKNKGEIDMYFVDRKPQEHTAEPAKKAEVSGNR